jgi:hypothetical protein
VVAVVEEGGSAWPPEQAAASRERARRVVAILGPKRLVRGEVVTPPL